MKHTLKALLPGLAIVACALPAFASPTVTYTSEEGKHPEVELEYELNFVEVEGIDPAIERSVNRQLHELVLDPKRVMFHQLEADPMDPDAPGMSGVYVGVGVGVVTDDLLSISISVSTYFAGAAHPNLSMSAASFDLRTGEEIDASTFFPKGKGTLIGPIHDRLVSDYLEPGDDPSDLFPGRPTLADIRHVVVEPEGMTFVWGSGDIAGYAMGPVMASLTWAELGDSIDRDGILASAIARAPRPSIDLALGEDGGEDPDAPVVADNREEYYLMGLEDQGSLAVATLTVEDRIALLTDESWRNAENGDAFLAALDGMGLNALASKLEQTRTTLRTHYKKQDYANLGNLEAGMFIGTLDYALSSTVSGRVVTMGSNLIVREHFGESDQGSAWGKPIARLAPGTVVAVVGAPDGGLFRTVQLADGRIGSVHKSYLLLETPVIDERDRVYGGTDGFTLGKQGYPLVAKGGPGAADAELDALIALVGDDGMSAPVNVTGIRREIGFRPAWVAVLEFVDLSTVDQLGEGHPAVEGVNAQLPTKLPAKPVNPGKPVRSPNKAR